MATVAFSKLNLKLNTNVNNFQIEDQVVEVKQYLPIKEKLEMIESIINNSVDSNGFYNVCVIEKNIGLEIIYNYTNIKFTDKQKEDDFKLYDILMSNDFIGDVLQGMAPTEVNFIRNTVYQTITKIYEYRNSVYGILDKVSKDYKDTEFNIDKLQEELANPEGLELVKDIVEKLG